MDISKYPIVREWGQPGPEPGKVITVRQTTEIVEISDQCHSVLKQWIDFQYDWPGSACCLPVGHDGQHQNFGTVQYSWTDEDAQAAAEAYANRLGLA
jgi:hypothetical protein